MSNRYHTIRLHKKRPKKGTPAPEKPKAFKTEVSANDWAKEHNLKGFSVEKIGDKKFKIRTI